ncbi:hypothetical protein [Patulibacter minatonensis]|uniref:hypothetical protein n=1 Tax=Patulibacter minatonensis TaxID=298163 RepID=UPI000478697B|nr:hypothetical protein [Patulibacter minatonensis]
MRVIVSSRAVVGCAVLLLAASVALLWVPWFPLNPRVECGWTCYVPLEPGRKGPTFLSLGGRGGHSAAVLASITAILATTSAVVVAVTRRHLPRVAPVSLMVLGTASLIASTVAILRITGADIILVPGPDQGHLVGDPSVGTGAVVALATGAGTVVLGLLALVAPRAPGPARRESRAAAALPRAQEP